MYFWRIRKLRRDLIAAPLDELQSLGYLIAFVSFYFLLILIHSIHKVHPAPLFIAIYSLLLFSVKIVGMFSCFRANGGRQGHDFLKRYLALAWVELLRFIVFGAVVLIAGIFCVEIFVGKQALMTPHFIWMAAFIITWLIVYYARLYAHIKFVVSKIDAH